LSAATRWQDLDPLHPNDQAAYVDLQRLLGSDAYHGETQTGPSSLEVDLVRTNPAGFWDVTLTVNHADGSSESTTWNGVFIDPSKPFDSGLLQKVAIPGMDIQFVKVLE
jgi:hypothetical protein